MAALSDAVPGNDENVGLIGEPERLEPGCVALETAALQLSLVLASQLNYPAPAGTIDRPNLGLSTTHVSCSTALRAHGGRRRPNLLYGSSKDGGALEADISNTK